MPEEQERKLTPDELELFDALGREWVNNAPEARLRRAGSALGRLFGYLVVLAFFGGIAWMAWETWIG